MKPTKEFLKKGMQYAQKNPGKTTTAFFGGTTTMYGLKITKKGVKEQERSNDLAEKRDLFDQQKHSDNKKLDQQKMNFEREKFEYQKQQNLLKQPFFLQNQQNDDIGLSGATDNQDSVGGNNEVLH